MKKVAAEIPSKFTTIYERKFDNTVASESKSLNESIDLKARLEKFRIEQINTNSNSLEYSHVLIKRHPSKLDTVVTPFREKSIL